MAQHIQSLARMLPADCGLVCHEWGAALKPKHFKSLQLSQKCAHVHEAKEDKLLEEVAALQGILSTLHKHPRKDASRTSQLCVSPHPPRAPGHGREYFSREAAQGTAGTGDAYRLFHHAEQHRPSEATSAFIPAYDSEHTTHTHGTR